MKQIASKKSILQYLFIPGLVLSIAGLIAVFATQEWTFLYLLVFSCGNIFLFIWIFYTSYINNSLKKRPK